MIKLTIFISRNYKRKLLSKKYQCGSFVTFKRKEFINGYIVFCRKCLRFAHLLFTDQQLEE